MELAPIRTPDGQCGTQVTGPASGPAIIFVMNAGGIRPGMIDSSK